MDAVSKPVLAKGPRPVKAASAIVFAVALATILAALAFEHLGGYAPCPLCLQQRYAYYFAVPASAVVAGRAMLPWLRISPAAALAAVLTATTNAAPNWG